MIPLVYLIFGAAWIYASDGLIGSLVDNPGLLSRLQTVKGLFYVVATSVLLWLLLRPLVRRMLDAHRLLEQSEHRYRSLFVANPVPMWVYSPDSLEMLDVNPAALAFHGSTREEFLAQRLMALWPEQDGDDFKAMLAGVCAAPLETHASRHRLRTRSGGYRDVDLHDCPVDFHGANARLIAAEDRTIELQARTELVQTTERLREAQGIAHLGYWELNPVTGYGYFSSELYRLLGQDPPDTARWQHFHDLVPHPSQANLQKIEERLAEIRLGLISRVDQQLPIQTGLDQPRCFRILAHTFEDGTGRLMLRGTLQDITEQENDRRQLQERDRQFRQLVDAMPDGVMVIDAARVVYANAACLRQLGHTLDTLSACDLVHLVAEADAERFRQWLRDVPREGTATLAPAPQMRRLDGSLFRAGLVLCPIRYGSRPCVLVLVRDLTEPERIRDALAASNAELQAMARRLLSLQEDERRAISRDLHDDIGQAITAMKLSAHAAMEDEGDSRQEELNEIVALADATIVKLRNLSMLLRPPQLDALGLAAAIRWQAGVLFRASSIELELRIGALPVRPSNEVEQACFRIAQESLTNVVRHAHAGRVELSLSDLDHRSLQLRIHDDGDGFDPEDAHGLGLVVMRERAQAAGGTLHVTTAPGAGTTVELQLPYAAATAAR